MTKKNANRSARPAAPGESATDGATRKAPDAVEPAERAAGESTGEPVAGQSATGSPATGEPATESATDEPATEERGHHGTPPPGRVPAPVANTAQAAGQTLATAPATVASAATTTWRAVRHRRGLAAGGGVGAALVGAGVLVARRRARRRRPLARLTRGRLGS